MQVERTAVEEPRRRAVDGAGGGTLDLRAVRTHEPSAQFEMHLRIAVPSQAKPQRRERDAQRRHRFGMRAEMIVPTQTRMRNEPEQQLGKVVGEALRLFARRARQRVVGGRSEHGAERCVCEQGSVVPVPFLAG